LFLALLLGRDAGDVAGVAGVEGAEGSEPKCQQGREQGRDLA